MEDRHPSQRFLTTPAWAGSERPERPGVRGLDLSDLRGLVGAPDVVRRAARNVSPLSMTTPSAWMLRDAIAKAHGLTPGQIFPRISLDRLLGPALRAFVGAEDHIALSAPIPEVFTRQILALGARYVDIGRGADWEIQREALDRLIADGQLSGLIVGRPGIPSGSVTPLEVVRQGLHAQRLVIVDETMLAYSDPIAGLPRPVTPKVDTALSLFDASDTPTAGLIVLRSVPGIGPGELLYAVGEEATLSRLWAIDSEAQIPAPIAAAAWLALDQTAALRRVIMERSTLRAELRTAIDALGGYLVPPSQGPFLFVQRPGHEGAALAEALAASGLVVSHSPHPSWRDGVAFGLPLEGSQRRVVEAFEQAIVHLDGA